MVDGEWPLPFIEFCLPTVLSAGLSAGLSAVALAKAEALAKVGRAS